MVPRFLILTLIIIIVVLLIIIFIQNDNKKGTQEKYTDLIQQLLGNIPDIPSIVIDTGCPVGIAVYNVMRGIVNFTNWKDNTPSHKLSPNERDIFGNLYPDLDLDKITIYTHAFTLGDSVVGQTYGYDIYITYDYDETSIKYMSTVLHELMHADQFRRSSESYTSFACSYGEGTFWGMFYTGCSYYCGNPLEVEAYNMEDKYKNQIAICLTDKAKHKKCPGKQRYAVCQYGLFKECKGCKKECQNGGKCVDDKCICTQLDQNYNPIPSKFCGKQCEKKCNHDCPSGCDQATCECKSCPVNPDTNEVCSGHQCVDGMCLCPTVGDKRGPDCSTEGYSNISPSIISSVVGSPTTITMETLQHKGKTYDIKHITSKVFEGIDKTKLHPEIITYFQSQHFYDDLNSAIKKSTTKHDTISQFMSIYLDRFPHLKVSDKNPKKKSQPNRARSASKVSEKCQKCEYKNSCLC